MTIRIYTDGSCKPNPGRGGWGAIVLRKGEPPEELFGHEPETTNNRMELVATIEALRSQPDGTVVEIYTDSQYVRNGITDWLPNWIQRGFRTASKKPVQNADLWRVLGEQNERCQVRWNWVKAHAGDRWNERADRLARAGMLNRPAAQDGETANDAADLSDVEAYLGIVYTGTTRGGGIGIILRFGEHEKRIDRKLTDVDSANRVHIQATIDTLQALTRPVSIRIYTTSDYLANGASQWLDGWRARGWRTKQNEPVRHRDLWEELAPLLEKHTVTFESVAREERAGLLAEAKGLAADVASRPD